MDFAAIFFTLAILVLLGIYLYAPFVEGRARRVTEEEHELSALLAERDRVINSLQELDFDFRLGKIPNEDYPTQRANLLQKGANILRKIDELASQKSSESQRGGAESVKVSSRRKEKLREPGPSPALEPDTSAAIQDSEERIERAIAARRADLSAAKPEPTDDDLEAMISSRREGRRERSAGFCPKCGKPVLVSDRFCSSCGKALT